ncbi:MAG: asparagine synthase (glutamine-hydrolyzing) [Proteobacteria bacterium]|nr:asparagine synthase (glutamine-hydrolyzing) [Pseudomonadota bacterium]
MGGIAGIVHFRGPAPKRETARAMSAAVAHRGPNDSGTWAEGPAILVQRRLALAEAGRRQPIAANPHTLVLDGRIYALGSLAKQLEALGVEPRTAGDADMVLSAWSVWGSDTVARLHGDFALAVWDRRDRVLHLARDPAGVKPLFYTWKDGRFAFASDVRALLLLDWVSRDVAVEEIAEYLSFRYTHAPRTLLRDIRLLPAGHVARVGATGVRLHRWWLPEYVANGVEEPSEDEARDRLELQLDRGVRRRLVSDVPVGVLLSGGSASTAITALASRRQRMHSVNVSFADAGADEAAFAGRVASLFETEHSTLRVSRDEFLDAVPRTVQGLGQPLTSPAAVLQGLIAEHARERGIRVLLSGAGVDEVLGGPAVASLVREIRAARLGGRLPGPARGLLRAALGGVGRGQALDDPEHFGLHRSVGGAHVFDQDSRVDLLRDPGHVRPGIRRLSLEPFYAEVETDPINQVLHVYQRGWLSEDPLLRSDRTSMSSGVEVRYPLLDRELVEWAASLPGSAKLKRRHGRYVGHWPLIRLVEQQVGAELAWRPKRGMPTPLNRWLRGPGEAFLWERIESVCDDPLGLFRADSVRQMARRHAAGDEDLGPRLWTLIFFDAWLRTLR